MAIDFKVVERPHKDFGYPVFDVYIDGTLRVDGAFKRPWHDDRVTPRAPHGFIVIPPMLPDNQATSYII